jgi:hypothetical protein
MSTHFKPRARYFRMNLKKDGAVIGPPHAPVHRRREEDVRIKGMRSDLVDRPDRRIILRRNLRQRV